MTKHCATKAAESAHRRALLDRCWTVPFGVALSAFLLVMVSSCTGYVTVLFREKYGVNHEKDELVAKLMKKYLPVMHGDEEVQFLQYLGPACPELDEDFTSVVSEYAFVSFTFTIVAHAVDKGLELHQGNGIVVCNAVGLLIGRIMVPFATDKIRFSRCPVAALCYSVAGVCFLSLPWVQSFGGMVTLTTVKGVAQGYILCIKTVLIADYVGVAGVSFCCGVGGLVAIPVWLCGPMIIVDRIYLTSIMSTSKKTINLPKYTGAEGDVPVDKCLRLFEAKARNVAWSERDRINYIGKYLEDSKKGRIRHYYEEKARLGRFAELNDAHIISGLTYGVCAAIERRLDVLTLSTSAKWFAAALQVEVSVQRDVSPRSSNQQPVQREPHPTRRWNPAGSKRTPHSTRRYSKMSRQNTTSTAAESERRRALKDRCWMVPFGVAVSAFLLVMSVVWDYVFHSFTTTIVAYAVDKGFELHQGNQVVVCSAVGLLIGRIVVPFATDKIPFSRRPVAALCYSVVGVSVLSLAWVQSYGGVVVLAVLKGVAEGYILCIKAVLIADYQGVSGVSFCCGVGGLLTVPVWLCGPIIIGFFRDTKGSYDLLYVTLAALCFTAASLLAYLTYRDITQRKQRRKRRPQDDVSPEMEPMNTDVLNAKTKHRVNC
ncbi:hypothetical protein HPB52_001371 [Rhipicephalus sanguineus]|uniref:Monocarboxylate transporter n=1 Tax=Rhipicephalus sanguineus TaxID=34632 RepID=A0A9D4SXA2_RHISA|nr:hypothetical protein HPB52_001371 [Rhipicephalus sanguineus]